MDKTESDRLIGHIHNTHKHICEEPNWIVLDLLVKRDVHLRNY